MTQRPFDSARSTRASLRVSGRGKTPRPLIYLASQSPRRRDILKDLGFKFKIVPSSYEEKNRSSAHPEKLVKRHALGKIREAKVSGKAGILLGADTIVWLDGVIYSKPKGMKGAVRTLSKLSGREHRVYTGVALKNLATGKILTDFAFTKVKMKKLSLDKIHQYFETVNPLDKAGAYAIQEGFKIVQKISGSHTNVIGLPKELLSELLKKI